MATFTAIKNKTQSGGTLARSLDYVKQEKKTLWEERRLVSGWNCVAQSAYDEMMATKRQHGKTEGRMFYQFVQSFDPAEDVTPQEVHDIGLELAQKLFPEFEVMVATHVDADHLHNHLIVNSVSWKDGRKLHQNAADLQRQRQVSDAICKAHGLTVLEPPKKHTQDQKMRPGEYRSAVRGESWKFQLINTIDLCMRRAKRREGFVREMERRGYQVRWEPTRQCITYTTPKGKKCRDNRLHEDKYRKEVMERELRRVEDRALEKITEERYQTMMPSYEQERTALLETQKTLAEAISASEQVYKDVEAFLPLVRQYTDLQELNARILNELIEKIIVHEKERSEDGTIAQQVDIYYKFIGYISPAVMLGKILSPAKNLSETASVVAII